MAPLSLLLLAGCTHLATVEGAIPVAPGARETRLDLSVAREPNIFSTPTGTFLPAFGFEKRYGLDADTDLGLHAYTVGLGVDVRHRLLHAGDWHVALDPGLSGALLPIPSFFYANLDLALPLRVEHPLGRVVSLSGGPGVIARQTWASATTDSLDSATSTFELYGGGDVRFAVHFAKVEFGLSGTLYVDTLRATGLYGGVGLDFGWWGGTGSPVPPAPPADALREPQP